MRYITIVGELVNQDEAREIWEAMKDSNKRLAGLRLTMLGYGDQVTKANEVCDLVSNLQMRTGEDHLNKIIELAHKALDDHN